QAFAAESNSAALLFRNGDILYGSLQSLSAKAIEWQRSDADGIIAVKPDNVAQLELPAHTSPPPLSTNNCEIYLTNGDTIEGDLAGYDGTTIKCDTWYAGSLNIPRGAI